MTFEQVIEQCGKTAYDEPEAITHINVTSKAVQTVLDNHVFGSTVRMLDVGIGNGIGFEAWNEAIGSKSNLVYVGVTILESEHKAFKHDSSNIVIICSDMHKIQANWFNEPLDLIWARHVIEHSPFPLYMLKLLRSIIADGGCFYMEVPMPETDALHEWNDNHYSVLTEDAWVALLTKADWKVLMKCRYDLELPIGKDVYYGYICVPNAERTPA